MSKAEILEMSISDYSLAIQYCWETYTERRVLYSHAQLFKESQASGTGGGFNVDWSAINPVSQELKKKKRRIPKTFLESLRRDGASLANK